VNDDLLSQPIESLDASSGESDMIQKLQEVKENLMTIETDQVPQRIKINVCLKLIDDLEKDIEINKQKPKRKNSF